MRVIQTTGRREADTLAPWVTAAAVGVTAGALLLFELLRPLRRRRREPKLRRNARNLAVAATTGAALALVDAPVTRPLARLVERRGWGLAKRVGLPRAAEVALAALLLDYTFYLWHVVLHRVPGLWRFHQVHHVDLDMDASTAVRFHAGEIVAGAAFRSAQIVAIGVSPLAMSIWSTWLLCAVLFHHSNVELPHRVERWLAKLVVTPRMHGIHHSIVPEELHANWSSGVTLWDVLHRTLRLDVPQDAITIGVAPYRDPAELTFPKLMAMPFASEQRDDTRLPDGTRPARAPSGLSPAELLP